MPRRSIILATVSSLLLLGAMTAPASNSRPSTTEPTTAASMPADLADELREAGRLMAKSGLPRDVPLPEKTPFEANDEDRAKYLRNYVLGFSRGNSGMIVTDRFFGRRPPESMARGYEDGYEAGTRRPW